MASAAEESGYCVACVIEVDVESASIVKSADLSVEVAVWLLAAITTGYADYGKILSSDHTCCIKAVVGEVGGTI